MGGGELGPRRLNPLPLLSECTITPRTCDSNCLLCKEIFDLLQLFSYYCRTNPISTAKKRDVFSFTGSFEDSIRVEYF